MTPALGPARPFALRPTHAPSSGSGASGPRLNLHANEVGACLCHQGGCSRRLWTPPYITPRPQTGCRVKPRTTLTSGSRRGRTTPILGPITRGTGMMVAALPAAGRMGRSTAGRLRTASPAMAGPLLASGNGDAAGTVTMSLARPPGGRHGEIGVRAPPQAAETSWGAISTSAQSILVGRNAMGAVGRTPHRRVGVPAPGSPRQTPTSARLVACLLVSTTNGKPCVLRCCPPRRAREPLTTSASLRHVDVVSGVHQYTISG